MQLIHARPHCDNGCWPGRWARWEMEGTLTKWSYYSLSGHRPWELFRSLLIRLSQKSKKYSLPVCVCPLPSSQQSWGWVGKEILGGNKKPNCLADEPRQLMIWLISPPDLGSPCFTCDAGGTTHPKWLYLAISVKFCCQKMWSVIGSQNPNWMIVPEMLWHRWSSKDWVRWREFKAGQSKAGSEVGPIRVGRVAVIEMACPDSWRWLSQIFTIASESNNNIAPSTTQDHKNFVVSKSTQWF